MLIMGRDLTENIKREGTQNHYYYHFCCLLYKAKQQSVAEQTEFLNKRSAIESQLNTMFNLILLCYRHINSNVYFMLNLCFNS